jgi:hypothetical protein
MPLTWPPAMKSLGEGAVTGWPSLGRGGVHQLDNRELRVVHIGVCRPRGGFQI